MKRKPKPAIYPELLDKCQTCYKPKGKLTPSHLIKENHVHKSLQDQYDYYDSRNYITQCEGCHREFELLPTRAKFDDTITRQDYLRERGMWQAAARIDYLVGGME